MLAEGLLILLERQEDLVCKIIANWMGLVSYRVRSSKSVNKTRFGLL